MDALEAANCKWDSNQNFRNNSSVNFRLASRCAELGTAVLQHQGLKLRAVWAVYHQGRVVLDRLLTCYSIAKPLNPVFCTALRRNTWPHAMECLTAPASEPQNLHGSA